ncbi:hypothetical protein MP228_008722 [Amoeboaphelidium protococcarum]|nr:hypothetical protein MP228_008722 [Amoeboaphelidium protococcarum]
MDSQRLEEILSDDFDVSKLTIPNIKSILLHFDALPQKQQLSNGTPMRKNDYVQTFRSQIHDKRQQLRKKYLNVKGSARGIQAVNERGSPQGALEDVEYQKENVRSSTSSLSKSSSNRNKKQSPTLTAASVDPFDNPFQRRRSLNYQSMLADGSSDDNNIVEHAGYQEPPSDEIEAGGRERGRSSSLKKRKSLGRVAQKATKNDTVSPAQDASAQIFKEEQDYSSANNVRGKSPSSARRRRSSSRKSGQGLPLKFISPTIPFPIAGYSDVSEVLKKAQKDANVVPTMSGRNKFVVLAKVAIVILSLVIALASVHLQRWKKVPYCAPDSSNATYIFRTYRGIPLTWELPECRPCPSHGICLVPFGLKCEAGYLLYPQEHVTLLQAINPLTYLLPPRCVADTMKGEYVDKMVSDVVSLLANHDGAVICGESDGVQGMSESTLQSLMAKKYTKLSHERFQVYWNATVNEIEKENKQLPIESHAFDEETMYVSKEPNYPLLCRITIFIRDSIEYFKYHLVASLVALISLIFGYYKYLSNVAYSQMVEHYVDAVKTLLIEQEKLFRIHKTVDSAALSQYQLRDFVLSKDFPKLKDRMKVWQSVVEALMNKYGGAFVRECNAVIEGEVHDGLQWIGGGVLNEHHFAGGTTKSSADFASDRGRSTSRTPKQDYYHQDQYHDQSAASYHSSTYNDTNGQDFDDYNRRYSTHQQQQSYYGSVNGVYPTLE